MNKSTSKQIPKRMPRKQAKQSWVFKVECLVTKSVVLENCTEEEARNNPWSFAVEETETGMIDWEFINLEPNN